VSYTSGNTETRLLEEDPNWKNNSHSADILAALGRI